MNTARNLANDTPLCTFCGLPLELYAETSIILRGSWMPSAEYETAVFMLDPDTQLRLIEYANGQLGLITDHGTPTQHAHDDCLSQLTDELDEEEYPE